MTAAASIVSERDFQRTVVEMARAYGWLVYGVLEQFVPARRLSKGFPDLVMVRGEGKGGRLIFAELKSEKGRLTIDQLQWLAALGQLKGTLGFVEVYTWRPSSWDEIEAVLGRVTEPAAKEA